MDGENGALYCEADVEPGEVQPVNPSGLSLIGWPGIVRKNAHSGRLFVGWQLFQKLLGEFYVQKKIAYPVCETSGSLGAAVGIGNIGLDVEDGGAVQQVRTADNEHRPVLLGVLHLQ